MADGPGFDPERAFAAIRRAHEAECRVLDCVPEFSPWIQAALPAVTLLALVLFVFSGASARLRDLLVRVTRRRWLQAVLFAPVLLLWVGLAQLPVRWWLETVVKFRTGPNIVLLGKNGKPEVLPQRPFSHWFEDKLDDLIWPAILLALILPLAWWVVRRLPRHWWTVAATVASVHLVTVWAERARGEDFWNPGFQVVEPIPAGPLGDDLRDIAAAGGLRPDQLVVGQQGLSNAGSRAEARFWGGRPIAILGEQFLNRLSVDPALITDFKPYTAAEVRAVAGHEVAHVKLGHTVVGPLIWLTLAWMLAALAYLATRSLLRRFGQSWRIGGTGDLAAAPVIALCLGAAFIAWHPLRSATQLLMEHRADAVGLELARDPDGMVAFAVRGARADPLDWPLAERLIFVDHPFDGERIRRALRWKAHNVPARWRASGQSGAVRVVKRRPHL